MGILMAVVVVLCCLVGMAMIVIHLPGIWLILLAGLAHAWWADWSSPPVWLLVVLAGIAVIGEVVEFFGSMFTARRAGASRQAIWAGLIGGILGMFFLTFLLPIPILGTVMGALAGCFLGAWLAEVALGRTVDQSTRVGLSSALGFLLGTVGKLALAMVMSGLLIAFVLFPKAGVTAEELITPSPESAHFSPVSTPS